MSETSEPGRRYEQAAREGFADDAEIARGGGTGVQGDFANEHDTTNLIGEVEDGPEHVREEAEPEGLSGMD